MAEAVPVVNDSAEGLAQMYQDLDPLAIRLKSAAFSLLFFSLFFIGSLEGLFGLVAAMGVLCCSAPGSLGTAYAARCTRIMAMVAASLALIHIFCLSAFSLVVMPNMPHAFHHVCAQEASVAAPQAAGHITSGLASVAPRAEDVAPIVATQDSPIVATQVAPVSAPPAHAVFVATISTAAARRLQALVAAPAPETEMEHCERAERAFSRAVPSFLLLAMIIECGLFFSALRTVKAATRLLVAARTYGANAI